MMEPPVLQLSAFFESEFGTRLGLLHAGPHQRERLLTSSQLFGCGIVAQRALQEMVCRPGTKSPGNNFRVSLSF